MRENSRISAPTWAGNFQRSVQFEVEKYQLAKSQAPSQLRTLASRRLKRGSCWLRTEEGGLMWVLAVFFFFLTLPIWGSL